MYYNRVNNTVKRIKYNNNEVTEVHVKSDIIPEWYFIFEKRSKQKRKSRLSCIYNMKTLKY